MKIKIIFLSIIIFLGCSNEDVNYMQISTSKSTAISNAINLASPGVVGIYKYQDVIKRDRFFSYRDQIRSNGSGFLISQDGYIVTNAHNIEFENYQTTDFKITVILPGGDVFDAIIVGVDQITDIALLKISGNNFDYCNLGDSNEVIVGEWVIALGNPRNLISNAQYQPIASAGIVSAINADFSLDTNSGRIMDNMIQTDASLNPGNSGGPLIDSNGDVIGINTFIKADSQNLGFAIPINFAMKIAQELRLKGGIDRRYTFGLSTRPYLYGSKKDKIGLFIDSVNYNSTAINEELFRGDIIVAMEGYEIESWEEINILFVKLDLRAGDEVKLTVLREENFENIKLILGEVWKKEASNLLFLVFVLELC